MQATIQSVKKFFSEVTLNLSSVRKQQALLIMKTVGRKNYAEMARENRVSYKTARILKSEIDFESVEKDDTLVQLVKKFAHQDGILAIDATMIHKPYAEKMQGVTYDYDGVSKDIRAGFSAMCAFWSDGKLTIPIGHTLWFSKEDAGEHYQKKTDLMLGLVDAAIKNKIPFWQVVLDGAFPSFDVISHFHSNSINYTARTHKNRVVEIDKYASQLQHHPALRLTRNQKYKTCSGFYKGIPAFFTVYKRKNCHGEYELMFIISSLNLTPAETVTVYQRRWVAEKFFRTAKQKLGLADCRVTDIIRQRFHIQSVMLAYAILDIVKNDRKKSSVETVLFDIRRQKIAPHTPQNNDLELTFTC